MRAIPLILVLAACNAMSAKNGETLTESVRAYNDNIRWERFANAAIHIPANQRSQFVDEADQRAHDVKITDYEVVKVDTKTAREARVQVKLSWYKESEGTVHETQATQTWEQHGKSWLIVDEARLRGTEMPGLPEPLMKD